MNPHYTQKHAPLSIGRDSESRFNNTEISIKRLSRASSCLPTPGFATQPSPKEGDCVTKNKLRCLCQDGISSFGLAKGRVCLEQRKSTESPVRVHALAIPSHVDPRLPVCFTKTHTSPRVSADSGKNKCKQTSWRALAKPKQLPP